MIKFIIAGRRKREDTQERYFYEWGIIHVALMITTPAVMKLFKRYVQHYSVSGISNDMLIHPLSEMEWDNMADHWVENYQDLIDAVRVEDYVKRMHPHVFGDPEFVLEVARGEVICESQDIRPGGVKLLHFLKKKREVSDEEFQSHWRGEHAAAVVNALKGKGLLRKYVQNRKDFLDPGLFAGTLFQMGGTNPYEGIEEFWFDGVDDLVQLKMDKNIYTTISASEDKFVDSSESFSMVVTERIIYDYTLGEKSSPAPAVFEPNSLEAQIYAQGFDNWNIPRGTKT